MIIFAIFADKLLS